MYTLPAGTYYIGDPCYLFPNDGDESLGGVSWDSFCNSFSFDTDESLFRELVPGHGKVFLASTAYGDGAYDVYSMWSLIGVAPVDAGLISIFPESLYLAALEKQPDSDWLKECFVRVEFPASFSVSVEKGVSFGYDREDICESSLKSILFDSFNLEEASYAIGELESGSGFEFTNEQVKSLEVILKKIVRENRA